MFWSSALESRCFRLLCLLFRREPLHEGGFDAGNLGTWVPCVESSIAQPKHTAHTQTGCPPRFPDVHLQEITLVFWSRYPSTCFSETAVYVRTHPHLCTRAVPTDDQETVSQAWHAEVALQADRLYQQGHGGSPRSVGGCQNGGRPSQVGNTSLHLLCDFGF